MRFFYLCLAVLSLCQAVTFLGRSTPVYAQGVVGVEATSGTADEISWTESRFENVREGYQSLQWNPIDNAQTYRVVDSNGLTFFEGNLNEAFISGLPDGEHSFQVQAFSVNGDLIASSRVPAVIVVNHWPMTQAWILFGIGLVVFIAMIGAIVIGSRDASHLASEQHVQPESVR